MQRPGPPIPERSLFLLSRMVEKLPPQFLCLLPDSWGTGSVLSLSGVLPASRPFPPPMSQQMMNALPLTTPTRSPTWRHPRARRTPSTGPAMPHNRAWAPRTGQSQPSGRRACMPVLRHPGMAAWKTSAATHGRLCPPTAAARWPLCLLWTGSPTSTSLPTSPRGHWCPGWQAWPTMALHSWQRACSRTRAR